MAGYVGYKRTIQLDFNYEAVKQGVPKVNQQMALLNSEFNKASAEIQATGSAMDKLTLNNQKLSSQVQLQKDKVSGLEKELSNLTNAEVKNERAMASKRIELNNAQAQLTKLQTAYSASNKEVEKSKTLYGQAQLGLENFRLGAERAGVDLNQLKNQVIGISTAMVAFVAGTTSAYMSYETELVQARNIMDESVMTYDELNEGVKELANTYGFASKEMAKSAEAALSSNVATQDLFKFLGEASKFAITTFTDLNTAVDLSTSLMNSYGYSIEELPALYNQLINTQKLAKVSWEDYNSQIGGLAALGSQIGVSLEEVNTALVLQTSKGIDSAQALTNLKSILDGLSSPSSMAATKAKELGIGFNAAALESKGLTGVLGDIVKACKNDNEAMATLFGNTKAWTGATILASNGGKDFKEVLASLDDSAGMLDNSLKNVEETTGHQWRGAIQRLKNSVVDLGQAMAPVVEVIAKIVDQIAKIPVPVVLAAGAFTVAYKVCGVVASVLSAMGVAGVTAGGGLAALGTLGSTCIPVVLAIAAAIALVVGMLALLSGGANKAKQDISSMSGTITQVASDATNSVNNIKTKKGYASGTSYVKEDGYYTVNEGNETETFLRRGQSVKNGMMNRKENSNTGNTDNLLINLNESLNSRLSRIEDVIKNIPRDQLRYSRM